ncbi:MAG: hypothetical protein HYW02_05995 [Deltaproteobacteria bacterium]|nr:hypothetical protein [Deltaproteobacteria bacterium]MBI2501006.1 hypothetical protein [Deltaproteobacteria bacterium]MBI4196744.1 hypothetical protein [Deltaproteobacteria bacterium]
MKPLFVILLLLAIPSWGEERSSKLKERGFTSAKVCGECHEAIYEGWKGSMHANAVSDPIFYPIFIETSRETRGKSDSLCLSCHAPFSRLIKGQDIEEPMIQQGVSCDFCHRVREVRLGAKDPFVLELTQKKWGPLKGISSPFHPIESAPHFEKSVFCAGCHEYTNDLGAPIFETYSEWRESSFGREGRECQSCHMPAIEGSPVPLRVKPVKEVYINSHEAVGGHSIEQVKKAVEITIGEARRSGDKVHAVVRLKNVGSGHKVPTGMPTRKLILQLQVTSGGTTLVSEERIYQKIMVDKAGNRITRDSDLFLKAFKVKEDNRLKPGEEKIEHFTFFVPQERALEISARLYYLYQPRLIQETEMRVDLGGGSLILP